ncbi:helix-turn-helix domain-containing protein [Subtercola lobariae]|uniref:Helix-turn-helix domain-containing protein n=1 Tax=Subtercola lobariae TaxID=1588641 RepID=A0A917BDG4_9MICO|nr:helix-turn-helix domain-containing protein [Subtercola lobariae]GGF37641.1 hypothetical protein GCM10011399_33220 [Subtercola lobariae]
MPALNERATEALGATEAARLGVALQSIRQPSNAAGSAGAAVASSGGAEPASPPDAGFALTVGGTRVSLGGEAGAAVLDLLQRLADGHAVVVASTDSLLTTSQAAELIGISATYLLRLANNGVIAVEYRGTHRRFRLADATAYLEKSRQAAAAKSAQQPEALAPESRHPDEQAP